MKIIVGLGNPGPRYANTRHNVGFRVLDRVADRLGAPFDREKYHSRIAEARHAGDRILLIQPLTFMNRSGLAVAAATRHAPDGLESLLVVADDVNLPLGKLRIRKRGSAGGHNGLKSIIEHCASDEFARLRLGVGPNVAHGALTDHVLGGFFPDEKDTVHEMIERAAEAVSAILANGIDAAMNIYN